MGHVLIIRVMFAVLLVVGISNVARADLTNEELLGVLAERLQEGPGPLANEAELHFSCGYVFSFGLRLKLFVENAGLPVGYLAVDAPGGLYTTSGILARKRCEMQGKAISGKLTKPVTVGVCSASRAKESSVKWELEKYRVYPKSAIDSLGSVRWYDTFEECRAAAEEL